MRFLCDKIKKMGIGWNERPLTESDFYRLCKRFKVSVTEMPLTTGGFYYRVMGRDFIAVDSKLTPTEKLFVLFHELGHFLFHVPETGATANFHGVGRRTRKECEADVFALCAMIPRAWIESRTHEEPVDDEGFTPPMLIERLNILARYGM
jgi:Zn-dependent peptidase ImmA (M78 family)